MAIEVSSILELKAQSVSSLPLNSQADVLGFATPNDGGGGMFYYDPMSSAADDGGTIIEPNSGNGRWLRKIDSPWKPEWFGAVGNGVADDRAAFEGMFSAIPDKSVIQTAGDSTYLFEPVDPSGDSDLRILDKSLTVFAYGSTFKLGANCRPNLFNFRPTTPGIGTPIPYLKWFGGTFDGNEDAQHQPYNANSALQDYYIDVWNEQSQTGLIAAKEYGTVVYEDIEIKNHVCHGLFVIDCDETFVTRCHFHDAVPLTYEDVHGDQGGSLKIRDTDAGLNRVHVRDSRFINVSEGISFSSEVAPSAGSYGIISGCHFENASQAHIHCERSENLKISDCDFWGDDYINPPDNVSVPIGVAVRSANVVTVTAVAHGLSPGNPIYVRTETAAIAGVFKADSFDVDTTVASVPDANTFTYTAPGADGASAVDKWVARVNPNDMADRGYKNSVELLNNVKTASIIGCNFVNSLITLAEATGFGTIGKCLISDCSFYLQEIITGSPVYFITGGQSHAHVTNCSFISDNDTISIAQVAHASNCWIDGGANGFASAYNVTGCRIHNLAGTALSSFRGSASGNEIYACGVGAALANNFKIQISDCGFRSIKGCGVNGAGRTLGRLEIRGCTFENFGTDTALDTYNRAAIGGNSASGIVIAEFVVHDCTFRNDGTIATAYTAPLISTSTRTVFSVTGLKLYGCSGPSLSSSNLIICDASAGDKIAITGTPLAIQNRKHVITANTGATTLLGVTGAPAGQQEVIVEFGDSNTSLQWQAVAGSGDRFYDEGGSAAGSIWSPASGAYMVMRCVGNKWLCRKFET